MPDALLFGPKGKNKQGCISSRTIRVIETMMSSPFGPAQSEGLCLRYPESAGLHREISLENAVNMLGRAAQVAQTVPFTWGYIDKPNGKYSP